MKITRLEISNFKRIFAVDITPSGNIIIIGGENKAGKSSTLDSIESGLRGKRSFPDDPIRHGADKATIRITLSPSSQDPHARVLIATRIITEKKQYFEVKYEDGSRPAGTPQSIMDKLLGAVSFDFMDFLRLKPDKQHAMLQEIVGLDFTKVDAERSTIYDARRDLNRDIERIKGSIALIEVPDDTPDESVDVDGLMAELKVGQDHNRENEAKKTQLQQVGERWKEKKEQSSRLHAEIVRLNEQHSAILIDKAKLEDEGNELKEVVKELVDVDLAPMLTKISASNDINIDVRKKQDKAAYQSELKDLTEQSEGMTQQMKEIDEKKAKDLSAAPFPVPGLGFGDGLVVFKDCPLSQASDAEQIEVGIGIGASLHPELAVMLIRNGSNITPTTMKDVIVPLADKYGLQLFVEDCRAGDEATLIIEAGRVKGGGAE